MISVGDQLPDATLTRIGENGPEQVQLADKLKGRKVVLFAVPGAFTSTCHSAHVPSFIRTKDQFAAKGVDEIICLAGNDPFVMSIWGDNTGATEAGITNFRRVPALDTSPAFIEGLAHLVQHALEGPEVNLDQAAALPTTVKLYPQDKWAWGWNNSSEVWNGRLAMLGFSAFLLELLSGRGPLHSLGLL